jgi:hypothetical protein
VSSKKFQLAVKRKCYPSPQQLILPSAGSRVTTSKFRSGKMPFELFAISKDRSDITMCGAFMNVSTERNGVISPVNSILKQKPGVKRTECFKTVLHYWL